MLRTNISDWNVEMLWPSYIQLNEAEAALRIHNVRIRCVVKPERTQALLLDRLGLRLSERLRPPPSFPKM